MKTMLALPIALLLAVSVPALAQNPNNNGNHGQGNNGNGNGNGGSIAWRARPSRRGGPPGASNWRRHLLGCKAEATRKVGFVITTRPRLMRGFASGRPLGRCSALRSALPPDFLTATSSNLTLPI